MQRIERYGVIALLLLLVTVLAVSMWGDETVNAKETSTETLASATRRGTPKNGQAANRKSATRPPRAKADYQEHSRLAKGPSLSVEQENKNAAAARAREAARTNSLRNQRNRENARRNKRSNDTRPNNTRTRNNRTGTAPADNRGGAANFVPKERELVVAKTDTRLDDFKKTAPSQPAANLVVVKDPQPEPKLTPASNRRKSKKQRATWTVKSGETLSEIAEKALGSSRRWTEIIAANPSVDPQRLSVGTKLVLPKAGATANVKTASVNPVKRPAAKSLSTKGNYTVQSGDVLSLIAERELGSSKRWREIVALNPGLDPKKLSVGTKLTLPKGAATTRATETRSSTVAVAQPTKRNRVR